MRSRLVAPAVACALLLATTGAATAGPAEPERSRRLGAGLEAVLARPELRVPGRLGVRVTDAAGGVVLDRGGHTPLLPASTLKLVTAAAALRTLGPGFRYVTRVVATRQPDDGVVRGDIVVVGSGDPALATATYGRVEPDRPRTPLEALAGQLRRAGVRRVTGRVVGDPGLLAHEPLAAGWPDRYLDSL
ncbi:MAG: D-alanyl-D-alanine carboxypeptidase, partial [Actinobacteria bacterium]|nr:D-alanyl-D-alanine carboxypeptidase [Actinomycetota bacterium]